MNHRTRANPLQKNFSKTLALQVGISVLTGDSRLTGESRFAFNCLESEQYRQPNCSAMQRICGKLLISKEIEVLTRRAFCDIV